MVIFNPSEVNSSAGSNEGAQTKLNMNEVMPVFVAQLRELLRVPHVVSTVYVHGIYSVLFVNEERVYIQLSQCWTLVFR